VTRRAWLMMAVGASLWGASYMFIKLASEDFSAAGVVCLRTTLGAAVLLAIAVRRRALGTLRGHWGAVAAIAGIQVVVPFLLITVGEHHIASSLTGILVSSAPIFTALLAIRFDREQRLSGWGLVGIAVGLVGIVLLFGLDLSGDVTTLLSGGMALLASIGYATGALLVKHRLRGVPPVAIAAATIALSAAATAPLFALSAPSSPPSLRTVGALLVLGAGGTGVSFLIFYTLIAEVGPARASVIAYLAPAFSLLYGVTLLGEPLTPAAIAGLALILAGSWLGAEGRAPISRSGLSRSSAPASARVR
jgi:drug/metabolite transporter (DMT)-like permease